jgi:hypothetical protein
MMYHPHLHIHQIVIMMQLHLLCHWAVRGGDAVDPKEKGHWFGGHHVALGMKPVLSPEWRTGTDG